MAKEFKNGRCCVFQPFDKGDFDKRFDDVLTPAVEAADMEPYRVDRDLGSTIPVDTLHQEIRSAVICIADITTRNPNVMYELGYSIAAGKDVVIICGPTTEKFPFDIQHRGILSYSVGSTSDFKRLEDALTAKLNAILARQEKTIDIASASPIKSSDGLQPHELTALAMLLANSDSISDHVSANWFKQEMRKAGYTEAGTRLAIAKLVKLGYARSEWQRDQNDDPYVVYGLTSEGEDWLLDNQSLLVLSTPKLRTKAKAEDYSDIGITDDDIPF
jgi:hypothetical protein